MESSEETPILADPWSEPARAPELEQRASWPTAGELSPDLWPGVQLREVPRDRRQEGEEPARAYCPRCGQPSLGSELVDLRGLSAAQLTAARLPAFVCTQCLRFLNMSEGLPLAPIAQALGLAPALVNALAYHDTKGPQLGLARPMRSLVL